MTLAHIALGTLSAEETEYFYKSGILFQLGDDLLDVVEDSNDGNQTLWTRGLKSKSEFKKIFNLYSRMETYLESEGPGILAHTPGRDALIEDTTSGFKFYLLSAFLNPELDSYIQPILKSKFPLGAKNSRNVAFSLFKLITETKDIDERFARTVALYGQVFDRHFLKGQYERFADRAQSSTRAYKIRSLNPLFPMVRFATGLENYFRHVYSRKTRMVELHTIFWTTALSHIYFLGQIHSPTVKPIYMALGIAGIFKTSSDEGLHPLVPVASILITSTLLLEQLGLIR